MTSIENIDLEEKYNNLQLTCAEYCNTIKDLTEKLNKRNNDYDILLSKYNNLEYYHHDYDELFKKYRTDLIEYNNNYDELFIKYQILSIKYNNDIENSNIIKDSNTVKGLKQELDKRNEDYDQLLVKHEQDLNKIKLEYNGLLFNYHKMVESNDMLLAHSQKIVENNNEVLLKYKQVMMNDIELQDRLDQLYYENYQLQTKYNNDIEQCKNQYNQLLSRYICYVKNIDETIIRNNATNMYNFLNI